MGKISWKYKNVLGIQKCHSDKKKYLTDKIYSRDEKNVIRIKKKKSAGYKNVLKKKEILEIKKNMSDGCKNVLRIQKCRRDPKMFKR